MPPVQDEEIDLRGLAARAARDGLKRMGAYLERDRLEDLVSYLTVVGVKASQRFDPSVGQARSTWVYRIQRRRISDWYRQSMGDRRHSDPLRNPRSAVPRGPQYMRQLRANETAETGDSLGETLGETLERMGEHLSDEGKDMLRRVAVPMAAGLKSHEVGRALGLGPGETERRLTRLRGSCAGAGLTQSCPSGASERRVLCECNTEAKGLLSETSRESSRRRFLHMASRVAASHQPSAWRPVTSRRRPSGLPTPISSSRRESRNAPS